ncbi:NepR family anti-sigma factor [Marivita sp. S0852]
MNQHPSRPNLSEEIDANLKRAFDQISKEEVPDRFSTLLAQLRAAEQAQAGKEQHCDT